jgi:hypothetical protein
VHSYSVSLRITGEDADPAAISAAIGVSATQSWRRGETFAEGRVRSASMWEYEVVPDSGQWVSLEDGLVTLVSQLRPLTRRIREAAGDARILIWCGHYSSSFDGGPIFSPSLLKMLADFGVEIVLDTYSSFIAANVD